MIDLDELMGGIVAVLVPISKEEKTIGGMIVVGVGWIDLGVLDKIGGWSGKFSVHK